MQPLVRKNAPVLIVGSAGAGKSYYLTYLLLTLKQKYKVVIDPNSEYYLPGFAVVELDPWNYRELLKSFPEILDEHRSVTVQFSYISLEDQKKLVDYLAALSFQMRNTIFAIDEAHLFIGKSKPAPNAVLLATMGRKFGISPIYVSQRPQQLDTTARSQTWFKAAFRLNDLRDVDALRGYIGYVDLIPYLPARWFLFRDRSGKTYLSTTEGLKLPHFG